MTPNRNNSTGYVRPEPPAMPVFAEDSSDAEVWLDFVTAATRGYASVAWSKDGKNLNMVSAAIAGKQSAELADVLFAEYKRRTIS